MRQRQGRTGSFPQAAEARRIAIAMSGSSKETARSSEKRLEFDLRGRQMNRIEAVSDVVFGFALTLLVVSLQVPQTYADLIHAMRGFPAFALAFAALMMVWARHY